MIDKSALRRLMTEFLNLEDLKTLAFNLDYRDFEITKISQGARELIERADNKGQLLTLLGHLIVERGDVEWSRVIEGTQQIVTEKGSAGSWNIVVSMIEENRAKIVEVRERVINLQADLRVDDIRDIVMGRPDLNVVPIRDELQKLVRDNLINRYVMLGLIAFQILAVLIMAMVVFSA